MKYYLLHILLTTLIISACDERGPQSEVDKVIADCIKTHGGKAYNDIRIAFDFRDKSYIYDYNKGKYQYERIFIHEKGNAVRDILNNSNFERYIDGKLVRLSDEKAASYSSSVNSVHYFAFLPFFLKNKAVNSELQGTEQIKNQPYYKIKVTFDEEGGGEDFKDVYVYWIHEQNKTMDYLAYSYDEKDDKGVRFRSAYNPRTVGGIRFQDYVNYKHDPETPVAELGDLFNQGKLKELSRIELKNFRELKRE